MTGRRRAFHDTQPNSFDLWLETPDPQPRKKLQSTKSIAVMFGRFSLSLTIATAVLAPTLSTLVAATACYYPDGSTATGDTPCGNGTDVACCGKDSICLTNGLCMDVAQPYSLARSSCSDQTWTSSNCPNYCLQSSTFNGSGCSVVLYTYLDGVAEYCCNNIISEDNSAVCAGNYSRFQVEDASVIAGYAFLANYTLTNTTSNSTNSSSSSNSSSNHDAAIGAGVGVPLGVIALASIAWALWERRKLHRLRAGSVASSNVPEESKPDAAYPMTSPQGSYQHPQPQGQPDYSHTGAYGQEAQSQYSQPRVLSEMAVSRGPVELDSRRA